MSRTDDIVPVDASEDQLRELYGPSAEEVIAFRRFLGAISDSDQLYATANLAEPHRSYARGSLTGAEYLAALELYPQRRPPVALLAAIVLGLVFWILAVGLIGQLGR